MAKEMSFIILSTGRAGSGYVSKLLTEAGIPTGHEASYNLAGYRRTKLMGESSWLALPFVEEGVYSPETTFYHQVRHPLKVIGSLVNGEMQRYKEYLEFQYNYLPMGSDASYLDYSARFVYEWNNRIEQITKVRWRVEDIDFNTIQMIAYNEGLTLDRPRVVVALSSTSKTTNKHPNVQDIEWDDIQNTDLRNKLKKQAKKYGYRVR